MRTVHYENCENATSETCRCAWCCGTRHGWQGATKLAVSDDPTPLRTLNDQFEEKWRHEQEKLNKRSGKRPTYPHKSAAVGLFLVDVLSRIRSGWLGKIKSSPGTAGNPESAKSGRQQNLHAAGSDKRSGSSESHSVDDRVSDGVATTEYPEISPPSARSLVDEGHDVQDYEQDSSGGLESPVVDQVQRLGVILEFSLREVEKEYKKKHGGEIPILVRRAMTDHFWCEILAQLAHVIDQGIKTIDSAPDLVTDLVIQCRHEEGRSRLEKFIVKAATNALWKRIRALALFGLLAKGRAALLVIRVLAVFVCKQPGRHRTVVEYCIDPLGKELLEETKKKLLTVLHEWLPRIKKELDENGGGEAILGGALPAG